MTIQCTHEHSEQINRLVLDNKGLAVHLANLYYDHLPNTSLNDLIGVRFRIGEVLVEGNRPCHPCAHLNKVTGMKLLKPLENRGGLRASILTDGRIAVGDPVVLS